jgi:AraC-like DNA-binding protein
MSSRLDRRSDWEELAAVSDYRVEEMARHCRISPRQLQRHFLVVFGQTPKRWLDELRARAAAHEILHGALVKRASSDLHFKQASHFTKFFKRVKGTTPTKYAHKRPPSAMSEMDNKSPKRITNVAKR